MLRELQELLTPRRRSSRQEPRKEKARRRKKVIKCLQGYSLCRRAVHETLLTLASLPWLLKQ